MAHVTDAEFAALIDNCTTTWTTRNGVYGRPLLVLHAAFGEFRLRVVPVLRFGLFSRYYYDRYSGFPVRPLRGFAK